jgi:phosphoribosylaminoimidazole-succinocarboxamide synthase
MELIKTGKTKDVYKLPDGNYILKFKDAVTGRATGESDSCCANSAVISAEGAGLGALKMSAYYFDMIKKANIPTHFVSADFSKNEMTVRPAQVFGNGGLRCVLRYRAAGCFVRRYGMYCREGDILPKIFEVTVKDSERGNPPAAKETLMALNILSHNQYDEMHDKSIRICDIVYEDLKARGLELIDIKIEFGIVDGCVALIDEVSAGNMRVFRDGKKMEYLELAECFGEGANKSYTLA